MAHAKDFQAAASVLMWPSGSKSGTWWGDDSRFIEILQVPVRFITSFAG